MNVEVNCASSSISSGGGPINILNTSYGTPSSTTSFTLSGSNLSTNISIAALSGFEFNNPSVNSTYTSTLSGISATGPTTINVRLASTANVGAYAGNIVCSSGSTTLNVPMATSTVSKATPTISISNSPQTYTGAAIAANLISSVTGVLSNIKYDGSSTPPTNAGTYAVTANFVPTDGSNFNSLTDASAGNYLISKATPTITASPTASSIILGQALSTSTLSGGTATPTGGTFAFTSPSTVPGSTGSYSASVTYTPSDNANYNTTTASVNVSVVQSVSAFSNTQFTSARNITRGTTELPIYRFQVDVTNTAATLNSLTFSTPADGVNSNYIYTDITAFKVFLTTSPTFSNSNPLGVVSNSFKYQGNLGESGISFPSLTTSLNVGTTYYIWLTADVLSTAIAGRTIIVNAPTIGITGTVSGTNLATGTQTIIGVPTNYYLNAGGSLTTSSNYFTSPNGAGTTLFAAGLTYASNDVILNIPVSVTNTSDFTLGNGSKIVVQAGGSLTVGASNTITGTIDVNDGGTLTVNNTAILHTLGTLGTTSSTVVYNASGAQTVATKNYANLTISGGNTKTLAGAAAVSGTLTINGTVLAVGSNNLSPANLTLDGLGTRNGTWGSTASSATYKNNNYFSGSGLVTVTNNTALTPSISGVTASQSITYGAASITLTGTVSATGPVYPANGETVSVTINGNTQTTTTTGGNGAFSITYTCNTIPYSATPYTISYAYAGNGFLNVASHGTSTLTINKATLTVAADDKSKTYDGAIYAGGYTSSITGFVNNETVSVVSGAAAYSGTAISATNAGSYMISPVVGNLAASNYTFSFSNGTLTINKATPTLSVTNSLQTYTGSSIAATVASSVPGVISNVKYDGSSTPPTNAGTYAVTANLVPTDGTNYNSLTDASAGNFVINKATPTLSIGNSPQTYSGSTIAATVSGSVAGVVSNVKYGGSLTVPTNAGTYAITANLVPTDGTNYNSLTDVSAGNFVISKADQYITFASTNSVFNTVADYNPGATSASSGINAITYTSSNTAVATIVLGNIHVTGVGQTTITASQTSSPNYNAASATQTLTVNAYTSIITQPVGYTILATGATPTALSVTAIGTNLSYQWYSNTTNSTSNSVAINSATSANYTPPSTSGAMYYYVVVHGDFGSDVTSNVVAVVISDIFTWNGSVSTDWNTAANWTPASVPIATANVSVPNLTNNPVIGNLSIASNGSVTLASGTALTLSGTITNNGTFTIESGATLVQTGSGNNSGNGTYNVKQNVTGSGVTVNGLTTPNGRFWYMGPALSNASSTALLASNGNQLWQWNESSFSYAPVTSGQTLTQGKSYVLRSGQTTETINFSGTSLSNGTVNVTGLSRTGTTQTYRGCHLISNPYPSYLDWNAITKNNIGTTMYIRTALGTTLDAMETYNSAGGGVATTLSSVPLTQYIAPMQGFWVKVSADNLTGSLTMTNAMRSHQPTGSGLRSSSQDFPAFLRLNMLDGQNKDQVILLMSPDATMNLDAFDSEKMSASGYAQFYSTVNAKKLVINGMKNVKAKTSVPLTLEMPTSKSYTFQAEEFNIEDGLILLEDKQEGVIQDLTINPTYSFFGNAGTNATRFVVHFQLASAPVLVGGPQQLESLGSDELTTENIQIISNNQGTVIIRLDEGFKPEGSIRIFDASGRLVEQRDFNDQETTIQLNEQAGMYFVEVAAGKLMVKKKIVIE
ncbi:MAG: MBG domain-containing protein [Flavobacteriia bacterium]